MGKVRQKIASIIATVSVTGTLMASFPVNTNAAIVNENNENRATNVKISLEDAANYGKELAIEKNASSYGLADNVKEGAILHAWCWSFNTIKENLKDIAEAGFTTVQTSPANQCLVGDNGGMSIWSENGQGKWEYHYQPTDWKIGNYQLGTREEFKSMCEEADKYGIKIIVDVLPNHTTPQLDKVSQSLKDAAGGQDKLYHGEGFNSISQWENRYYCTNGAVLGLPDVNTENPGFQKYYLNYLNDLIDCGVDGFRYDTAKHIGLPDDPQDEKTKQYGWKNNFWPVAIGNESVDGVSLHNKDKMFIYGEVLQSSGSRDDAYGKIINLTASGYGYTLRGAIGSKDFSTGRISDWGNAAGASKLVTWVESHDTYCNNGESVWLSDWDIRMCWAIIAARKDGTPLFYSRPDGSTNNLGGRWGNNKIGAKGNDQFKDPEVAAVNKFRNAMVGEGECLRNPNGSSQILQIDRGTKGTVIINLGGATSIDSETSMANGAYTDQVSGRSFTVSNGKISGQLDAGKIAVIYNAPTTRNPRVLATPGSGSFKGDSVTVTLGLANATTGTYTTSEGASGSFKDGDKITVGTSIAVGEKVTVTLKANGDDPESTPANETFTYTKKDGSVKKNTVYFTAPSGWSTPTIYAYSGDGATATQITGAWPGTAMTSEGDGVYSYTFDDSVSSCSIIFASGSNQIPASQQPGFSYVGGKAYEYVSSWNEVQVEPTRKGTVTVKYVDEDGNDLTSPITLTGNVGDSYTTSKKTFSGYTLSSTPTNAIGKYTASNITVTYKYTKDEEPIEEGKVIVKYIDEETNEEIASRTTLTGNVGESYEASAKEIDGYTLSFIPSNATGVYKSSNITVTYEYSKDNEVVNPPVISSFTADKKSPQVSGTQIKLTAKATGNGTLQYKFLIKDSSGNWAVLRDYGKSNVYTWKTGKAGNKTIYVDVKDSNGKVTRASMSYTIKAEAKPPVVSSFTADKKSPQASGTQIKLTAKATGTGTLQYKFLIKDAAGNWSVLRDYGTSNTYTWKAGKTGNKTLYVDVKDSNGKVTRASMSYKVEESLIQDSNAAISYTGTWKVATSTRHSGGTCKYVSSVATATYKFTGTGIKLIAPKSSDKGIAKVTIDSKVYYVDLYSASAKDQSVAFSLSGLTSGTHTIKVEWTGLKNNSSKGTTITLDAFEIIK
jgi:alpha-amylase